MIIQLSKSTRAFTCNSCVQIKFPLVATSTTYSHFPIDSISPTSPSFSIHPTSPSPSTFPTDSISPLPPLITQVPTNPLTLQPPPLTNNKAQNKPVATKSISSTSPKPCKFYMQGQCCYGEKALVALIHIFQCASSSLRVVIKDVPRVTPVSMHILKCVAHPFYPISVTELNAISIMLQAQLGPNLIKTYPEIQCQKAQFLIQLS